VSSQGIATTEVGVNRPAPTPPGHGKRRSGWWKIALAAVVIGAGGGAAWLAFGNHKAGADGDEKAASAAPSATATAVEIVLPKKGVMEQISSMVGSVHPFEWADLYANVSGFLKSQEVEVNGKKVMADIGVRVKKGDLLAEIDVPEVFAARDQAAADLEQAESMVHQADARIAAARAEQKASQASVVEAEANVGRYTAAREETSKSFNRYKGLRAQSAVEQDVVDQKQDAYESAVAAEKGSRAAVLTAEAKVEAAKAEVVKTQADRKVADANVKVAKAKLAKAQAFVDYTRIRSPYTGVITARNFFPGDFIRSASEGNSRPLLTVSRTDLMRVVTKISDVDVPFANVGDPAVVTIDALPGERFPGKIARFSESEIPSERTMRTEIDLPNDEHSPAHGRLREGMFGQAYIQLTPPSGHLTIPSSTLIGPAERNKNAVLVLRDGHARRTEVLTGADNGVVVEIVSGLKPDDQVILPSGSVADGTPVIPTDATKAPVASHS
jgi:HlyD family secretion protein